MNGPATRATTVVLSLFLSGVLGGAWAGSLAAHRARDPYEPVDTLVRVLGLIESTYVDEVTTDTLVRGAIDGMLEQLDVHSTWMSSEEYRDLQRETHGSYTGIGVEVKLSGGGATVTRVLPGSPASREGLAVGDRILAIDGKPLGDVDLDEVSSVLLGPRGTSATLEVLRDGWDNPREVQATRDEVHAPAVEFASVDADVLYVRLRQFQEGAAAELRDGLSAARAEGRSFRAVLLDLRDNPGGLLREAVAVTDLFLDDGVIVSTRGRLQSESNEHLATPGGLPPDVPMAVLVNNMSASASEIVAGALQDTARATLVGEHTYGKGSVQSVFEHRDGSALKLTIGRYYTPSGEPVAPSDGRVPDVVVSWPEARPVLADLRDRLETANLDEAERAELLTLLDAAPKAYVRNHPRIAWDAPMSERLIDDPQLRAAVDTLHAALR